MLLHTTVWGPTYHKDRNFFVGTSSYLSFHLIVDLHPYISFVIKIQ